MDAPHPLSREFSTYVSGLEDKIRRLESALDLTTANLGALTDRINTGSLNLSLQTLVLPAKVVGGDQRNVTVAFPGNLSPKNWLPDELIEREPVLERLLGIDEEGQGPSGGTYSLVNILNGATFEPESPRIFHGLNRRQAVATLFPEDMDRSCVPVYLYLGLIDADPWQGLIDSGINGIPAFVYAKPDLFSFCEDNTGVPGAVDPDP
jgi:hypothetical protein